MNKGVSEASKTASEYISVVLPGHKINQNHKALLGEFDEDTYVVHGDADKPNHYDDLEERLKKDNPIHQSTTTFRADIFDKTGLFYDSMNFAEDMGFYKKTLKYLGGKAIKNINKKVLGDKDGEIYN